MAHLICYADFISIDRTNGWFPDGVGNKPWLDQSTSECIFAMLGLACISSPSLASFNDFVVKLYVIGSYSWLRDVLTLDQFILTILMSSLPPCFCTPLPRAFRTPALSY